jgi:hypothetical protein
VAKTDKKVQIKTGRCFITGRVPVLVTKWVDGAWLCRDALIQRFHEVKKVKVYSVASAPKCFIHKDKAASRQSEIGASWAICPECYEELETNVEIALAAMIDEGAPEGFEMLPDEVFQAGMEASAGGNFAGAYGVPVEAPFMADMMSKKGIPPMKNTPSVADLIKKTLGIGSKPKKEIGVQVIRIEELTAIMKGTEVMEPIGDKAEHSQGADDLIMHVNMGGPEAGINKQDNLKGALRDNPAKFSKVAWIQTCLKVMSGVNDPVSGVEDWDWSEVKWTRVDCSQNLALLDPKTREREILNSARKFQVRHKGRVHDEDHYVGKNPCWVFAYRWVDARERRETTRKLNQPFCYA